MRLPLILAALGLLVFAAPARGQSFVAGARSLGVGGSFQGLADDTTAIFWNPAGTATVGSQVHGTVGSYARIDDDGERDSEPVPGPAFIGAVIPLSDLPGGVSSKSTFFQNSAIIGGYFSPFVNERRYTLPAPGGGVQRLRVEQFFNRLSLGYAKRLQIGDPNESPFATAVAVGFTVDLSITSIDGDFIGANGQFDRLNSREVSLGFSVGALFTLLDTKVSVGGDEPGSLPFELSLGATYHHPGDFSLSNEGFAAFNRSSSFSRLYDWPLIAGFGIAIKTLADKTLRLVADYQYVGWDEANHNLSDTHNVSGGAEYLQDFENSPQYRVAYRVGLRVLQEPSRDDRFARGIGDTTTNLTAGLGLVYLPRLGTLYYADGAVEFGPRGFNYALSLTLGF